MARVSRYGWAWCASVALAVAGGACSGASGSIGDQGSGVGAPGQNGAGGAPPAPAGGAGGGPAVVPGSTIFAVSYGDEHEQDFQALASDGAGNFYIAGQEFGPNPPDPTQGTPSNVFVVKYSPTGELMWRQPIPIDPNNALALFAIAVQPTTGAVILSGAFAGTIQLGPSTLTSGRDPSIGTPVLNVFTALLDSAGYFVWSRAYTSTARAFPEQVFSAADGDILVVGSSDNNATVGGGPLCCRSGQFNGPVTYLARYSPAGDFLWSNAIGGDFAYEYAGVNAAGDMVVGGEMNGPATFEGQTFPAAGDGTGLGQTGLVLRVDNQGSEVWAEVYPTDDLVRIGATIDDKQNVALFGGLSGTVDFGNGVSLAAGNNGSPVFQAGLVAGLAPDGTARWAVQFPASGQDQAFPETVATDPSGNVVVAGTVSGGLAVGGLSTGPDDTRFVVKYGADGTFLWGRGFPIQVNPMTAQNIALTVDPWGQIGFAGPFDQPIDFGTGPLAVTGQASALEPGEPAFLPDNVYLVKLAP